MAGPLTSQEVFSFLTPDQVHAISETAERQGFKAGDTIYRKGERADDFFIVLDGEITLRLPGQGGVSIVIDQLQRGAVFGGPLGFVRPAYALTAQAARDTSVLRLKNQALKHLMESNQRLGYHLQGYISNAYFTRYVDTMQKLQAIVMNLPVEA